MTESVQTPAKPDHQRLLDEAEAARHRFVAAISALRSAGVRFIDRAGPLDQALLEGCRVYSDRKLFLKTLPVGGVVAEVGVDKGEFSRYMIDTLRPSKIHLFDIAPERVDPANLADAMRSGLAEFHVGDSSINLATFANEHFDLIYIDGDHSYGGVQKDILAAESKLKPGGLMVMNDYTAWSPASMSKCGVAKAANEFANSRRWPVFALALQGAGYYDLALRRPIA
jgi:hypothetical protein